MSMLELYTQLFARSWRCGRFARGFPKGAQRGSERKPLSWPQGDGRADQFRSRSSWCSGDLRWKLDLLLRPRDQETEFPVEACWLSQTQEGQTEQIHPQTFDDLFFFFESTGMMYMHWLPTGHTVNKEYYYWSFNGVQEEIPSEEASILQIGSVAFPPGQCTSPQPRPYHTLFDQDGHQDSSTPSL